jgi:hypothetical protein
MTKALQHILPYQALVLCVLLLSTFVTAAIDQPQNSPASRCELRTALDEVHQQVKAMSKRFGPYIRALLKHCSGPLGNELANTAKQATEQSSRVQRSVMLAKAASINLSSDCSTDQPTAAASTIQPRCPGPSRVGLHRNISPLKDLDAGSYLFILAVHKRLNEAPLKQNDRALLIRYLENMVLSGALEGCKARGCSDLPTVYVTP